VNLYFDRHDGEACTIEDWLRVFEDQTGRDLTQFMRWYSQAGTPTLKVEEEWNSGTYTLTFTQSLKPSDATPDPLPQVIPIAAGLLAPDGHEVMPTQVLEMTEATQSFTFEGLDARPVPSVLRGFSAPVVLESDLPVEQRAFLLAHDTDPFNRWEAGRSIARDSLLNSIRTGDAPDHAYMDGMRLVLQDETLDPAYRALMLGLPGQSDLATALHKEGTTPDPDAIYAATEAMRDARAAHLGDLAQTVYAVHQVSDPFRPDAVQAGHRALSNAMLALLGRLDGGAQAARQYAAADNMTQKLAALSVMLEAGTGDDALAAFEAEWKSDRLVMDKWFALQVVASGPDQTATIATRLTKHPDFNWKNPNRFRSVMGALAGHHPGFHAKDGAGYRLLADWLIRLDPVNPQTTARMCSAFQTWRRYDDARQALIASELDRILATPDLSRDTTEMLTRIRGNS
uniref:DUF3458 domain-containing protein n=1 Tax=Roseobacter sp. TaxID=1907202 RepID=UPI0025DBABE7